MNSRDAIGKRSTNRSYAAEMRVDRATTPRVRVRTGLRAGEGGGSSGGVDLSVRLAAVVPLLPLGPG